MRTKMKEKTILRSFEVCLDIWGLFILKPSVQKEQQGVDI